MRIAAQLLQYAPEVATCSAQISTEPMSPSLLTRWKHLRTPWGATKWVELGYLEDWTFHVALHFHVILPLNHIVPTDMPIQELHQMSDEKHGVARLGQLRIVGSFGAGRAAVCSNWFRQRGLWKFAWGMQNRYIFSGSPVCVCVCHCTPQKRMHAHDRQTNTRHANNRLHNDKVSF